MLSRHTSGVDVSVLSHRCGPGPAVTSGRRAASGSLAFATPAGTERQRPDASSAEMVTAEAGNAAAAGNASAAGGQVGGSEVSSIQGRLLERQVESRRHAADTNQQQPQSSDQSGSRAHVTQLAESPLPAQSRLQSVADESRGAHAHSPASLEDHQEQHFDDGDDGMQPRLQAAVTFLVRLPMQKTVLKSAASLYAASGVVDDLFSAKQTYVQGDKEPMTRARHQYGLSPRQVEEEGEKRKEFANNLGAWYKAQLQRRTRVNTPGGRAISRSSSKVSE